MNRRHCASHRQGQVQGRAFGRDLRVQRTALVIHISNQPQETAFIKSPRLHRNVRCRKPQSHVTGQITATVFSHHRPRAIALKLIDHHAVKTSEQAHRPRGLCHHLANLACGPNALDQRIHIRQRIGIHVAQLFGLALDDGVPPALVDRDVIAGQRVQYLDPEEPRRRLAPLQNFGANASHRLLRQDVVERRADQVLGGFMQNGFNVL